MTDRMTPEQRHRCMSSIRSKATRPELAVRRWLWAHGYRYRLNVRSVPGSPDIVMRTYRTAIFVNGCFWHGHGLILAPSGGDAPADTDGVENSACCKVPQSNRDFWLAKIRRNQKRDERNYATLQAAGWQVIEVWECQLRPAERLELTMRNVELLLHENLLRIHCPHSPRPYADDNEGSLLPMAAEEGVDYRHL